MNGIINIPLKAFSINAMFAKNRSYTTSAYKDWSCQVFHKLNTEENLKQLEELRNYFDFKKHYYIIDLKFYFPKEIIYLKNGALSSRAFDISNIEKPLIDLLFLPKYFDKKSPYGCKNLNIDDKYIKKMSSEKEASEDFRIEIKLEIKDLEHLIVNNQK